MATVTNKKVVLNVKTSNALPLMLLALAALQLCMAALMVSISAGDITRPLIYAGGAALLGVLGLLRDALPPAVRVWAVRVAGIALLSIPVLALLGAALGVDLLTLPHLLAAPLLLLVAALVRPN